MKDIICPICGNKMVISQISYTGDEKRLFSEGTGIYSIMHAMESKRDAVAVCYCGSRLEFQIRENYVLPEYSDRDKRVMKRDSRFSYEELRNRQCSAYHDKWFGGDK